MLKRGVLVRTLVVFNLLLRKKNQTGLKRNVKQSLNICSPSPNFTFFFLAKLQSLHDFSSLTRD